VRHETDWGVSYILDSNFKWILKYNRHLFPQWFMDAVHYRTMDQIMGNSKGNGKKKTVVENKQSLEHKQLGRDGGLFDSVLI